MSDEIDKLRAHVEALSNRTGDLRETIQELERENSHLRDRVSELERVIAPDPEAESYEDLSREQKVFKLRTALVSKATDNQGRARMKYNDVKWLFNDHPSPGHTYDLMKLAGNADGFDYNDKTGEKRITVDIGDVNDNAVIRAANKTTEGTPA